MAETFSDVCVRDLLRADPVSDPLAAHPTDGHPGIADKKAAEAEMDVLGEALAGWQERLYAEGERSLLLVLQGMDTSGKGGVIKKVIGAVNPQGCRIVGFKKPTEEEASHHFLWRIERALPNRGQLGIFDRSHYEDVIVPRVHQTIPDKEREARYTEINEFEAEQAKAGITVVKCLLHISYDEQRERLLARLDDPTKQWKFRVGDIEERAHWKTYQDVLGGMVRRTHTPQAPWYVIPADRKWYRNWAIARILIETFEEMGPEYPQPDLDIESLKAQLAPPN